MLVGILLDQRPRMKVRHDYCSIVVFLLAVVPWQRAVREARVTRPLVPFENPIVAEFLGLLRRWQRDPGAVKELAVNNRNV